MTEPEDRRYGEVGPQVSCQSALPMHVNALTGAQRVVGELVVVIRHPLQQRLPLRLASRGNARTREPLVIVTWVLRRTPWHSEFQKAADRRAATLCRDKGE